MQISATMQSVDFAPATETEEIAQNIRTILTTMKGTVPLDRDFGLSAALTDLPINLAQARFAAEIVKAIKNYEPRADVKKVTFQGDSGGTLIPCLEVEIHGATA